MFSFFWHYCSAAWAGFRQFVYLPYNLPGRVSNYEKPDGIEASSSAGLTSTAYDTEEALGGPDTVQRRSSTMEQRDYAEVQGRSGKESHGGFNVNVL